MDGKEETFVDVYESAVEKRTTNMVNFQVRFGTFLVVAYVCLFCLQIGVWLIHYQYRRYEILA